MQRKTIDLVVSLLGLGLALILFVGGGLLSWANSFAHGEVKKNLSAQRIQFPPSDPKNTANVNKYAGKFVVNGEQAKVYANEYIAHHIAAATGGKTYSEVSSAYLATVAAKNPDPKLAELRQTAFMGETLRGILLNTYAFDTLARIAGIAAVVAYIGGVVFLILALLGLMHSRKATAETAIA